MVKVSAPHFNLDLWEGAEVVNMRLRKSWTSCAAPCMYRKPAPCRYTKPAAAPCIHSMHSPTAPSLGPADIFMVLAWPKVVVFTSMLDVKALRGICLLELLVEPSIPFVCTTRWETSLQPGRCLHCICRRWAGSGAKSGKGADNPFVVPMNWWCTLQIRYINYLQQIRLEIRLD